MTSRFACPCCEFVTLHQNPPGTYALCPVCFWEDDGVQFEDPTYEGGANRESLVVARLNFKQLGASEKQAIGFTRLPHESELPPRH